MADLETHRKPTMMTVWLLYIQCIPENGSVDLTKDLNPENNFTFSRILNSGETLYVFTVDEASCLHL